MIDQSTRERIAELVYAMIHWHPLLEPVLQDSRVVRLQAQEGSISARVDGALLEARIDSERWWDSGMETTEEWARRLTAMLAEGLRTKWDQRER